MRSTPFRVLGVPAHRPAPPLHGQRAELDVSAQWAALGSRIPSATAIGEQLDPAKYISEPGNVLELNLWGLHPFICNS